MSGDRDVEQLRLRIRELERNEEILKQKTERLEYAIDAVEDGIWDYDPRTGSVYFSPRWLSMLGYEPGELPSSFETWANLLHPDDRSVAEEAIKTFLECPDRLFSIEFRMRTKNNDWRWIHSRGKTIARDAEGNISRMVGTHVDITERKILEDSLRLTQFIYEMAPVGIFRVGADAGILGVNEEAARSLGYSKDELAGMSIFDINPNTNPGNWGKIWQSLLDRGRDRFEAIHRNREGTDIPVYVTSNLLEYDGEKFSIAFVEDITQRKRMEQALLQAQKLEAIGTLAGGIAHDFNNILSAVFGYAQLAQLYQKDCEKVQEFIRHICVASERAKELVMQILAFSRQGMSEKRPTDIGIIVREALKLLRASIPSTIEIVESIALDCGAVEANQTQFHQVVMNLCTNSAHALKHKGGKIVVELFPVEVRRNNAVEYQGLAPGRYLKLIVADNGHGMTPEILARVFEPYFTTKEIGEGTGMGLATVHGIVKDHGGDIKVYSEPGVGTTFHLLFPAVDDLLPATGNHVDALPGGTERILMVDDEPTLVDIGRELLTGLGYQVETCTNPIDCLSFFRINPDNYDLVITDWTMPRLDGEKLVQAIRKIRPDIPIIICTGFSRHIFLNKLTELGIDSMLMKPISAPELATAIRKALDAHARGTD